MRAITLLLACTMLGTVLAGCMTANGDPGQGKGPPESPGNKPEQPPGQEKKEPKGGFSDTSVFPGSYRMVKDPFTGKRHSMVQERGPYAIGEEQLFAGPIGADGTHLQIGYILPEPADREFPVIVQASVYYNNLVKGQLRKTYNSNPNQSISFLVENFVPHGYAVALVPVRGVAGNGGCYEWWGPRETEDLRRALNWIKSQPWSADSIGFIGLSLGGASAWMAAGLGDPDVKTIVPMSSENDLYSWFVRNGTASLVAAPVGTASFWFLYSVSPRTDAGPARDPARIPDGANCPGMATALAASQYMAATGGKDTLGYADARDLRPAVKAKYTGSIFLITGLNDWLAYPHLMYPWVGQLEAQGVAIKHLLGQWRHRMPDDATEGPFFQPTLRPDFAEILLHWFDYWLKGDTTVDLGPRVQVADSRMQWRNADTWPPRDAKETPYYLRPDLSLTEGPGPEGTVRLTPDPRRSVVGMNSSSGNPRSDCSSCHYFETPVLSKDLRISGIPHLTVTATPLGPGGVVTAYLYAVTGTTYKRIGWATMDLRFASGGTSPSLVTPGSTIQARLEFEPMEAHVVAGDKLVVELFQGGYGEDIGVIFPEIKGLAPAAYYRNTVPPNPVDVQLGGQKTFLELPLVKPKAKDFFTAPVPVSS